MCHKPLIGITCNFERKDEIGIITDMGVKKQQWQFLADNYINAVEAAGGLPIILPIYTEADTVQQLVMRLDGVIISGGNDVSPAFYGEQAESCGELEPRRDTQDIALSRYLWEHSDIPVLGICRGMQVLNVMMGGTLYQDLRKAGYQRHSWDESPMNLPVHRVKLEDGTRIRSIFETDCVQVNSYHHSAVRQAAEGLVIAGRSDDGVIEVMEWPGERFFLCVQWHPEMMYDDQRQEKLFMSFVEACRNR